MSKCQSFEHGDCMTASAHLVPYRFNDVENLFGFVNELIRWPRRGQNVSKRMLSCRILSRLLQILLFTVYV